MVERLPVGSKEGRVAWPGKMGSSSNEKMHGDGPGDEFGEEDQNGEGDEEEGEEG